MKTSLFLTSALAATGLAAPSTSPKVVKRGKPTTPTPSHVVDLKLTSLVQSLSPPASFPSSITGLSKLPPVTATTPTLPANWSLAPTMLALPSPPTGS